MRRGLALTLVCLCWWSASAALAATYYTAQTGCTGSCSNSNPCTGAGGNNAQNPLFARLTMNQGIACLASGDTLIVRPGVYDEAISDIAGQGGYTVRPPSGTSFANPTTIRAETTGTATIQVSAPGSVQSIVAFETNADFIVFQGFVLNGIAGRPPAGVPAMPGITYGIGSGGTGRVRYQDLLIDYPAEQGVLGAITNKEFLNVSIRNVGFDPVTGLDTCTSCGTAPPCGLVCHGYYTNASDTNALIDGGTIENIQAYAFQFYSNSSTIRNVTMKNLRGGGIWFLGGSNVAYNNVVIDATWGVISPSHNNVVVHNTIYATRDGGTLMTQSTNTIQNNLFIQVPAAAAVDVPGGTMGGNLCAAPASLNCTSIPASPSPVVNAAAGNFYPAPGSVVINAGLTMGSPYNVDKAGVTRPPGGYDVGALEAATGEPVATKLRFVQQPTTVVVGATLTPAVSVEVLDATDTRVLTATNTVNLALGTNPGGATLGGTTSQAASAGLATFPGLTLSAAGAGYTLAASSSGLTGVVSTPFTVSAVPLGGIQVRSIQSSSHFLAR